MTLVVDTSVALKWVVDEAGADLARLWVGEPLIAPDLLSIELANALWKKVRKNEISREHAVSGLAAAPAAVALFPSLRLLAPAFSLALELEHPVYDCVFLALAVMLDIDLVTADGRFAGACASTRYAAKLRILGS